MIRIRYSPTECEVSGSPTELKSVHLAMVRLSKADGEDFIQCDETFDPSPYPRRLTRLTLQKKEEKDKIRIDGDTLYLSGSSHGLDRLASFFDFPEDTEDETHVHHEAAYSPDLTDESSFPLIVCIQR